MRLRDLTVKAVQTQRAAILGRVLRSLAMGVLANPFFVGATAARTSFAAAPIPIIAMPAVLAEVRTFNRP